MRMWSLDPDGTVHHYDCPNAQGRWDQAAGVPLERIRDAVEASPWLTLCADCWKETQ